ncbi:MAG: TolC family protein [Deltaproteobacteria bacterium]|nr:TolC family protein [Deltaproteobacteria bacterium]
MARVACGAFVAWSVSVGLATIAAAQTPATVPAAAPDVDSPPPGPRLSLREVLQQASTGNPDLRRQRVAINLANANVLAAEGQFDFALTGDATFARRFSPRISTSQILPAFAQTFTANLALVRPLESGGQISLAAQDIVSNSQICITQPSMPSVCTFGGNLTYYNSNLNLVFTHPLLRGFGTEIATANLRKQRIQRDVSLLNRQAAAAVVIRDVVSAYWDLGYTADDLQIRRSAVTLAQQQRAYTQAQVDVGRLGQADLAAVDRAIADRLQDVALAEQTLLIRALDLERLMGRAVVATFVAPTPSERPSSSEPAPIDTVAETARALQSSPQLRALRAGLELSEIDVRTAQALLRPKLDFTGSVGTAGVQFGFGEAWSQAARFENIVWSAGLAFQLPLQNRAARGNEQAARASGEAARIDLGDLELGIRDGVVRMTAAARTAARRRELARAAVGYAQKNLDAERARFEVGRSTNNDVLLRQQELKNAEIQIARASADLANAETALAALTGEILDRYGVLLRGS